MHAHDDKYFILCYDVFNKGVIILEIIYKKVNELIPYEKNPRHNDEAVEYVANSIKEFGFKVPIVIDKNNVIVTGHTRYKASLQLGLEEVPVIQATDLTEEQIKAFRLADNKVSEKSTWDYDLLNIELEDITNIDMSDFDFESFSGVSYIDDLLENEYAGEGATSDLFSITFVFNKKNEDKIKEYIAKNGKEKIVEYIENLILDGDENA